MSRRSQDLSNTASSSSRASSRLQNSSSNSSSRETRTGRKRPIEAEEENEAPNNEAATPVNNEGDEIDASLSGDVTKKYDVTRYVFPRNEKEMTRFEALTPAVQSQCIKAVCRLFVMKGAKKESINRTVISKVLAQIEPEYKKHIGAVLCKVQARLDKSLGYVIVSGDSILGMKSTGKTDEYYVTNNLNSPKLMKMLNEAKRYNHFTNSDRSNTATTERAATASGRSNRASSSSRPNYNDDEEDAEEATGGGGGGGGGGGATTTIAFAGFLVLVCGTIYTAHQKRITAGDLLSHIRKVDSRFPTRLTSSVANSTVCPVPELEQEFLTLIKRMQKEHYLIAKKPVDEFSKGEENVVYSLGPRFYLDVGRKPLMITYFKLMDMPMDDAIMREIEEDAKKEQEEFGEDDEEEQAAAAPAPTPARSKK